MKNAFFAIVIASCFVPLPALAQQPAADPVFDEGRTLLDAGRFAEACEKFKTTYEQKPTAGKAFNLSVCEEKQGHLLRASQWMSDGLSLLSPTDERRPGAADRRDALEKRLGRVIVTLPAGTPPGVEVTVDGARVEVGARAPLDPGNHHVQARLAGHRDGETDITIQEGASLQVALGPGPALVESPRSPAREKSPPPPPPLPGPRSSGQRIAGAAITGLGAASLIGFGITAGLVAKKHSDFTDPTQSASRDENAKAGKNLEIAEAVLLAVGIAAAGTGVVLIATSPRSSTSARIVPTIRVGSQEGTLGLRGTF